MVNTNTKEFTGKYASIRKAFYKATIGSKYPGVKSGYKTEAGYRKAMAKKFADESAKIDKIEKTSYPTSATLTINWTKGGMYGYQAMATVSYAYVNSDGRISHKVVSGKKTGGYGYDKESTACADAFNDSPEFMKLLMDARAKSKKLPYGVSLNAGKPYFPHFNGGVGQNSINSVLKALGYDVNYVNTGNEMVTIYQYTLKKRARK